MDQKIGTTALWVVLAVLALLNGIYVGMQISRAPSMIDVLQRITAAEEVQIQQQTAISGQQRTIQAIVNRINQLPADTPPASPRTAAPKDTTSDSPVN